MALCSSVCAGTIPAANIDPCGVATRKGGINRLVFATCDVSFTDITDPVEWQAWADGCKVRTTGLLLGQKPRGSYEKRRMASCVPELVAGGEKIINFQDFNADNALFADIPFWNQLMLHPTRYQVGWFTCEGLFYGLYPFGIEVDEVIEDSSKGKSFKDGSITLDMIEIPEPKSLPGIETLLVDAIATDCTGGQP